MIVTTTSSNTTEHRAVQRRFAPLVRKDRPAAPERFSGFGYLVPDRDGR
ncbi:hypothetical protein KO481_38145 [Nocardia sp. NEAU-G5]|uniref:Uncharacterized protein n=1 Tax=Nocardia albiluteola TaxID=2842303 RepID=A0ABS6BD35_9NOCA|nr:hypothetical protein [Nocardia albiluteola]MBU3067330.1 hypothetical protein [Nocardia albiluteola]